MHAEKGPSPTPDFLKVETGNGKGGAGSKRTAGRNVQNHYATHAEGAANDMNALKKQASSSSFLKVPGVAGSGPKGQQPSQQALQADSLRNKQSSMCSTKSTLTPGMKRGKTARQPSRPKARISSKQVHSPADCSTSIVLS